MTGSTKLVLGVVLLVGLALAAVSVILLGKRPEPEAATRNTSAAISEKPPNPGFREAAKASGIDFFMNFLPGEQGEKFKTNLYDHGSGVAIGDFDGDGFDDIYFVNQLGQKRLYRQKGDGTFVDVTREAGVG